MEIQNKELSQSFKTEVNNTSFDESPRLLLPSDFIEREEITKPKENTHSVDTMRLISALELHHIPIARNLALDKGFMQRNRFFVASGEPIRIAIERGYIELAKEMIQAGYVLSNKLTINSIRKGEYKTLTTIIEAALYNPELSELYLWMMIHKGWFAYALQFINTEPKLNYLISVGDVSTLLRDLGLVNKAMKIALDYSFDDIASLMLAVNPQALSPDMVKLALERNNLEFLKKVWTGNLTTQTMVTRKISQKRFWNRIGNRISADDKIIINKYLDVSFILEYLIQNKRMTEAKKVINWPEACEQENVLTIAMKYEEEELALDICNRRKKPISSDNYIECLSYKMWGLAVSLLKFKECRPVVQRKSIQNEITKLVCEGETCYAAAEMLSWVDVGSWNVELTKKLITNSTDMTNKTQKLLMCPHPITFLILMAEFMLRLAPVHIEHSNRCTACAEDFLILAKNIIDSIKEENELQYFLEHRDTHNRTGFTTISQNRFYSLLENSEVASIISKMWVGDKQNYGIVGASTLYRAWNVPGVSEEGLCFFKRMDVTKPYLFQFDQWTTSCSLRFISQGLTTLLLVYYYTMLVHTATVANAWDDITQDETSRGFLRASQVWITGIFIEKILHIIFGLKTNRGWFIDGWVLLDFAVFGMMLIIMLDVGKKYFGEGNNVEEMSTTYFNTLLHGLMLTLIWCRLLSIIITWKSLGPLLRMIWLMIESLIVFLVLFFAAILAYGSVMGYVFKTKRSDELYIGLDYSIRSSFAGALGDFDYTLFTADKTLGEFLMGCYNMISNILLLNLLIAILTDIYERMKLRVDAEYNAVLINYYNKWRWDDNYGFMILLPTPITGFVAPLSISLLLVKSPMKWNFFFSKVAYIMFVLPQFALFAIVSAVYMPLVYLKSFIVFGKTGSRTITKNEVIQIRKNGDDDDSDDSDYMVDGPDDSPQVRTQSFSIIRAISWIIVGIVWVIGAYFRDCMDFWRIIYKDLDELQGESDLSKVQGIVNEKFIRNLQKLLAKEDNEYVPLDEFVNKFIQLDSLSINPTLASDKQAMEERHFLFKEYFSQFVMSQKDLRINISIMKTLLPKKRYYNDKYLTIARHINIPWINKGMKKFLRYTGTINIQGSLIPKNLITGETSQLKKIDQSMRRMVGATYELHSLFNYMKIGMKNLNFHVNKAQPKHGSINN
jgi:hypothetical protein